MAANQSPIFVLTPRASFAPTTATVNNGYDGTGTQQTVFIAGTNGSKIEFIYCLHAGNANTNISVVRVFINNGSTNTVATNNALVYEFLMPASTGGAGTPNIPQTWPANIILPAGYKIMVSMANTNTNGYIVTAMGGDY